MTDTFEADDFDDPREEDELDEPEQPRAPRGRRPRADVVPDAPIENAADIPLLVHAGTGKANTVTYLKITRLDGPRGVRGLKGQLPPESTYEHVARRYGNGTYKIEGCNAKHRVLAREEGLEISIPGFEEADGNEPKPSIPQQGYGSAGFTLHGMRMIQEMSNAHSDTVAAHATSSNEQVQTMANKTMEMLTAFTAAQRESEREAYRHSQENQQTFFATLMKMQETSHVQQMQMLTALQENTRKQQLDPMAMIQVFMDGLKAGGELGGEQPEPWLAALKEGSGMLTQMAKLASVPMRQLPTTAPNVPVAAPVTASSQPNTPTPKTRLPFKKQEIRDMAMLRAQLRRRGIPLDTFLQQTTEYYRTAPDAALFEGELDGRPDESVTHAATAESPPDSAT